MAHYKSHFTRALCVVDASVRLVLLVTLTGTFKVERCSQSCEYTQLMNASFAN
jgi:hypothetical protein